MSIAKVALFVFVVLSFFSCSSLKQKNYSETSDKYWSDLVEESVNTKTSIISLLEKKNPHLFHEIVNDSKDKKLTAFWGKSINFDSGAKKQIIDDQIMSDLQVQFKIKNDNKIVHAGITHSYGYLFSVISTPYGFKRKRWIDPTLNYAFSFSGSSLSPQTIEGGLLSNLTYFAGTIAFKDESDRRALKALKNVSSEVLNFDYSKLHVEKLEEEIMVNGSLTNILRTTLVKLPFKREEEENDYLLIYSIWSRRDHKEDLITAFPIKKDAYKKIIESDSLGPNRPILVRYNAYLEGFMDKNLTGTKKYKENVH